jgi:hypothetical protein
MPLAIALIFCVVLFAAVLVPFYAYVGLAIYLVWKRARRKADVKAAVARDAERQRSFNDREMRAWNAVNEKGQLNVAKSEQATPILQRRRDDPGFWEGQG